jgi:hypothetical protein
MSPAKGTPVSPVACAWQGAQYLPVGHAAAPQPPKGTRAGTLPPPQPEPGKSMLAAPPGSGPAAGGSLAEAEGGSGQPVPLGGNALRIA